MKNPLVIVLFFLTMSLRAWAQPSYFPPVSGNTWDSVSATSLGWCQPELDSLLDYIGNQQSKAFILLHDGKIVAERYYGTFQRDSLWYWASAGKSLTAFLTGLAQEQGYLSVQDTTSHLIGAGWTSCTPAQEEKITVRNQLTMTTGLDDGVADNHCTDDTCLLYLADAGTRWAYHNAPYTLLDTVIKSATGRTPTQFFVQNMSSVTGMSGFYFRLGYDNVFFSTARSFARFGLLVANRGAWDGTPVMTDSTYFNAMVNSSQTLNPSYGYLWWLNGKPSFMVPGLSFSFPGSWAPSAPADMFAALGKNGQILSISPSKNLVWIRMGDSPTAGDVPFTLCDSIWSYLNRAMCMSTGLISPTIKSLVSVFPNPCTGNLHVRSESPVRIQVMDFSGREVLRRELPSGESSVDIREISDGVYQLVSVAPMGERQVQKIIIRNR